MGINKVTSLAAAALIFGPLVANAATVQVNFSGIDNSSLDVYSGGYSTDTTPFSGTITYDSNAIGVTDPSFSYITDYNSAIQSVSLDFGGNEYVASGGLIGVSDAGPTSEHNIFFSFSLSGSAINSDAPSIFALALRSGTSTGSTALPQSFSLSDFVNGNGGNNTDFYLSGGTGTPQFFGIPTVANASPVPLPATQWLMLSGLGWLGIFARKKLSV